MRAGDYEKARELTTVHPEIPTDMVYKREWEDLVQKDKLKPEHIRDVLVSFPFYYCDLS